MDDLFGRIWGGGRGPYKWIRRGRKGWLIEEDVLTGGGGCAAEWGGTNIVREGGVTQGWLSPLDFVRHLDGDEARIKWRWEILVVGGGAVTVAIAESYRAF